MPYRDEILCDAKAITKHFDENIETFFKLWLPIAPLFIIFSIQNFIIPEQILPFAIERYSIDIFLKFLQYYGGSALCFHWIRFCISGETPKTWYAILAPNRTFLIFLALIISMRIAIDFDQILFFLLKGNHAFISYFNDLRYLIIAAYIGIVYLIYRLCFSIPMAAQGLPWNFKVSWTATKNVSYKIILSGIRAVLPYLIAIALIPNIASAVISMIFNPEQEKIAALFNMILFIPVATLLVPILLTLGASTLAYHYRKILLRETEL